MSSLSFGKLLLLVAILPISAFGTDGEQTVAGADAAAPETAKTSSSRHDRLHISQLLAREGAPLGVGAGTKDALTPQPLVLVSSSGSDGVTSDRAEMLRPTGAWSCFDFAAKGREWCERGPIVGNVEYRFAAGDGTCGGCWCCQRPLEACEYRLVNPGPFLSNEAAQDESTGCPARCPELFNGSVATKGWFSEAGTSYCWCERCRGERAVQRLLQLRTEMGDSYLEGELAAQKQEVARAEDAEVAALKSAKQARSDAAMLEGELAIEEREEARLDKDFNMEMETERYRYREAADQAEVLQGLQFLSAEQLVLMLVLCAVVLVVLFVVRRSAGAYLAASPRNCRNTPLLQQDVETAGAVERATPRSIPHYPLTDEARTNVSSCVSSDVEVVEETCAADFHSQASLGQDKKK
eukprot:TRINITY_DN48833_c0_g1_i1.p1 TRINITY_DN48833_c0_g1~~TRINITY_DN48833_c0_g1_i1.p1  ORF type:complete len:441 (+),score=89.36 TRINITY_DN48833_c0_g1_i1:95-1324(+)